MKYMINAVILICFSFVVNSFAGTQCKDQPAKSGKNLWTCVAKDLSNGAIFDSNSYYRKQAYDQAFQVCELYSRSPKGTRNCGVDWDACKSVPDPFSEHLSSCTCEVVERRTAGDHTYKGRGSDCEEAKREAYKYCGVIDGGDRCALLECVPEWAACPF